MKYTRIERIAGPMIALVLLAVTLVVIGLALTGPAKASALPAPILGKVAATGGADPAIVQFGQDVTVAAGQRVESVAAWSGTWSSTAP